jgi:hypothetical protein
MVQLPERSVMTGIGPVGVRQPRVRDRGVAAENAERTRFTPAILPLYARRSRSLEDRCREADPRRNRSLRSCSLTVMDEM